MQVGNSGVEGIEELTIFLEAEGKGTTVKIGDAASVPFRIPLSRVEVGLALTSYAPNRVSTDPLASLGSTLFASLFGGAHGRTLWQRLAEVERSNRGLRLRICSDLERIQHLPWETLFDPSRSDFMSLSGRVALVRTRSQRFDRKPTLDSLPNLRVIAVEANVSGDMRTSEDIAILEQCASQFPSRMSLTVLREATPELLEAALSAGTYDVFHFAGSGEVLPKITRHGTQRQSLKLFGATASPSAAVPLDDDDDDDVDENATVLDDSGLLGRQELGKMLQRAGVRLAVLNACHTDWIARSLAKYIPAAIGISESVSVESCLTLAESLYRQLLQGSAIDLSVTGTRQAVDRAYPGTGDWCKIIFYLEKSDGAFLLTPLPIATTSAASPVRGAPKEVVKLTRLLDVYDRNMAALSRASNAGNNAASIQQQTAELQQKRARLEEQLAALRAGGSSA